MPRKRTSADDREHGRQLGKVLADRRRARQQSASDVARETLLAVDTVRSIEGGRVPVPGFLTVARLAGALGISLDELHALAQQGSRSGALS